MDYYPPVSYYFLLSFTGISSAPDASFQEASGLSMELGVEEITEGGENRFKYKLPTPAKFPNLVLKRGAVVSSSQLATWCKTTFETDFSSPIVLKTITLSLLNSAGTKLMSWDFINAYPLKWSMSDFKSQESQLAIESIEFAYTYFTRTL